MRLLLIYFVALGLCCVSATPTPPFFGESFQPFGNWLQNIPRPPFFQNTIWNAFRPKTQVQVAPPSPQQQVVVPIQQQQVTQAHTNLQWPQPVEVPDRQISNNGWYWQNWVPLPIIPQYSQEQSPTIIIISRPAKKQPITDNSNLNATSSSGSTATENSSSTQPTNISAVVPTTNEPPSTSSPPEVPVSNSNEPLQSVTSTTTTTTISTPLPTSSITQFSSTLATEVPTQGNISTSNGNVTNVPDLGLTILNPVKVPLAPLELTTTNTSVPETTAQ